MADVLLAARPRAPEVHPESRAFQIAGARGGRVHLISVVRPGGEAPPPSGEGLAADLALRRAAQDVGAVEVREGEPWKVILEAADRHSCEVIVIGPSSKRTRMDEVFFGETAERLAHRARQPVLIVRRPAERPYRHVAAATDFSGGSRHALQAAAALLPEARLTLVNAYRTPFQGFLSDPSNAQELQANAHRNMECFLETLQPPEGLSERLTPRLVRGEPQGALMALDAEDPVDLVVLGAHGQTGALEKLLGGTAERLLKSLPMDVLLVREPA